MTLTRSGHSGGAGAADVGRPRSVVDQALLADLDLRVRERVRRDGVDPQAQAEAVRRIAEDMVRAHDERALTGAVAPVADRDALVADLLARVSGFGPLQPYLDDPAVEEVWINEPGLVH